MTEGIELLKFLVENAGIVSTIFLLSILFPIITVFLIWRLAMNTQKNLDSKIDSMDETLKELTGLVKGLTEIIKLVIFNNNDKGEQKERK